METLAIKLADKIISRSPHRKEQLPVLTYGITIILESGLYILCGLGIATLMGMLKEFLFFFLIFKALRSYAGGLHLKKFKDCLLFSNLMVMIVLFLSKNYYLNNHLAILLCIVLLAYVFLNGPIEHPNAPFSDVQKYKLRTRLLYISLIILFLSFALYALKITNYLTITVYTLLVVVFGMIIEKSHLQNRE